MTWDEVLKLPLETKVRLPWWKNAYIYLARTSDGAIEVYESPHVSGDFPLWFIQDQWELYQEPKKERAYMYGLDALMLVYKGKKVAFDDSAWEDTYGHAYLDVNKNEASLCVKDSNYHLSSALNLHYMNQKLWYVMEEE